MNAHNQGKAIAERDGTGWLLVLPDGVVVWKATSDSVVRAVKAWARKHTAGAVSTLELEWRS